MSSSPFKCSLFWVSLVVVAAAAWLWNGNLQRRHQLQLAQQQAVAEQSAQNAAGLLFRAFHADHFLTYSAVSKTTARMAGKEMETVARIVHAPQRLSILYLRGDYAGLHSGYNEHWAWRQVNASQPMIPYAEMEQPTSDVAARRFALLLRNYEVVTSGQSTLNGRRAETVELRPFQPAPGAQGPSKKLWIDLETGLTLRQQAFNYQMQPVMESVLTDVSFSPRIDGSTFVPPQKLREAARVHPWVAREAGDDTLRVARLTGVYPPQVPSNALPDGFEYDSVGTHRCDTHGLPDDSPSNCYAALTRYSDGLNALTVFAMKAGCTTDSGQTNQKKSTPAQKDTTPGEAMPACDYGPGTLVMRDTGNGQLIAVADLPAPILRRVLEATSVRFYVQDKH
jgi:hypothetical protein